MTTDSYLTSGGIRVHRTIEAIPITNAIEPVIEALDAHRGVLLASSYEYPGRYTRWDMGFVDPPLALVARGRRLHAEALNARGAVLLPAIAEALAGVDAIEGLERSDGALAVTVRAPAAGGAPSAHRPLSPRRRAASRALRRLRLRSRVPVRADPSPPPAPRRSARPRPLSPRRACRGRPPP
jgi:anthranilate synthase